MLIGQDETYANLYLDISRKAEDIQDTYFWITSPETFNLAEPLSGIQEAARAAIDEYEKVARTKAHTRSEIDRVGRTVREIIETLKLSQIDDIAGFVERLTQLRSVQGEVISLRDLRYADIAHQALAGIQPMMSQYPLGFGQWLQALSYALSKPREIAIVGDPDFADTQALLSVVRDGYRPFQVVALGAPGTTSPAVPLLQDRGLTNGQAAAYVCRDFACQAPVTEPEALWAQLEQS